MRKLNLREIKIRFGLKQADNIKTAYLGKHRCQVYSICRYKTGAHPFYLNVNQISDFGYVGMNHRFGLLSHARNYAHSQIDAVLGIDEVNHV